MFILLWILSAIIRGFDKGFLRMAFSFGGFLGGLLLGSWLAPYISRLGNSGASRIGLTLLVTLVIAVMAASISERAALRLQAAVKFGPAHTINKIMGIGFSACSVLVSAWLIAAALERLPIAGLGLSLKQSRLIAATDRVLPPAPAVIERLGRIISPHGFPDVFVAGEPRFDPTGPAATPEVEAAAAKAIASTVKIEGFGCGGVVSGSGFVAGTNYVVTNAHVVAGIRSPSVIDKAGQHEATVVWFDPKVDFAVLKTEGLSGPPLPLASAPVARGTSGAVLGYPGGGSLIIDPAVVLAVQKAVGRDIYDRGLSAREVYILQADIDHGNSGGPLVLPDGSVAGVIFGESITNDGRSYALTSAEIADDLKAAISNSAPVNTGPCAM